MTSSGFDPCTLWSASIAQIQGAHQPAIGVGTEREREREGGREK